MINILYNNSREVRQLWKFVFSLFIIFLFIVIMENLVRQAKVNHQLLNSFPLGLLLGSLFCLKVVYKANFKRLGMMLNRRNFILLLAGIPVPFFIAFQLYIIDRYIFNHSFSLFLPDFSLVLLFSFLSFLIAAAAEELFFRVYLIGYFREKFSLIYVFVFSALSFSLLHALANPSYNQNYFIALLLSGIMYGLLYLLSNSFYLVLSIHAFHNTFQLYPVNGINTNIYLLNQILIISYILIFGYYYRNKLPDTLKPQGRIFQSLIVKADNT